MTQDERILAIISARGEDIGAMARSCGWGVRIVADPAELNDVHAPAVYLVDVREGIDPRHLTALPRDIASVALLDGDQSRVPGDLAALGVTHFLPWPVGASVFAATLDAALAVRKRLNEATQDTRPHDVEPPEEGASARDDLTGLASRSAARAWLDARLGGDSAEAREGVAPLTACLLIGISQYASVNTAYGKHAGDAVLARVAARISDCVKQAIGPDALVARIGGTEYLVAYSGRASEAQEASAQELARLILTDVSRPFVADEKVIRLTARCGLAAPAPGDDAARLLRRVSAALADARGSSTSDICERSAVRRKGKAHADDMDQLDADLRLALDAGEIGIVYQPQYDSRSDRIVGVEALARWNHPHLGQLDAGTLFEAADRSDFLQPLSRHIQNMALREAGQWPASLAELRLSINVTAADLAQQDFVPHLLDMIGQSGFPRHRVTVEITESGLIENIARAGDLLQMLKQHDISVAIDDFGTGYSSLAYLKALHPDYLKIDHSLSRDILGTPRDRIILRAIIAMARSLALTVIAEGVESEEQLTLLAREGCDIYQGFLRSPALTSEELARLVERGG